MSRIIENDSVLFKYRDVWNKIKEIKSINFHKYIKAKVKELNGAVNTNFLGKGVLKEGVHYNCITCINIDSVIKMDKKFIHKFVLNNVSIN